MNQVTSGSTAIAEAFSRDGFFLPYDVIDADTAHEIRADLEAAEAQLANRPDELKLLHSYPSHLLPSFDRLIRHPRLIEAAQAVLGPDLMVWSSGLFIKEADTTSFVSWHQDLTYWGLDDAEEMTAWVALSPSTLASGCMKFIAGSHKQQLVAHKDSFDDDNLLTRGQEIVVNVDEAQATPVLLEPGQASLHHGHLFHASGPNTTSDRRIGAALRYIKPSMKQVSGDRTVVSHVSGEDRYQHFTIAPPPTGRLQPESFELCRMDAQIKARLLFEGAEQGAGKRYK